MVILHLSIKMQTYGQGFLPVFVIVLSQYLEQSLEHGRHSVNICLITAGL